MRSFCKLAFLISLLGISKSNDIILEDSHIPNAVHSVWSDESIDQPARFRRQLTGFCSWGQPVVSGCFTSPNGGMYCGRQPYLCDPLAGPGGRCCLPAGSGNQQQIPRCRDGSEASAACIMPGNLCGPGLLCVQPENICCRQACPNGVIPTVRCGTNNACTNGFCRDGWCCTNAATTCPNNAPSQGTCDANRPCPQLYMCIQGVCCQTSAMRCSNNRPPIGQCIANQCPPQTPPLQCEQPNSFCCETGAFTCPTTNAAPSGRCIGNTNWCPSGQWCTPERWCCTGSPPTLTCPNNANAQGQCDASGACSSADFVCVKGVCCQRTALRCTDGVKVPVRNCMANNQCPAQTPPLQCEPSNGFCCETTFTCPTTNAAPIGRCDGNTNCPSDQWCTPERWCCTGSPPTLTCPNGGNSQIPCDANKPCTSADFLCVKGVCCDRTMLRCADGVKVPVRNCMANNQCPTQTPPLQCEQQNNFCCPTAADTGFTCPNNNARPAGRCINGWCPPQFSCTDGWCCELSCPNNAKVQGTCDLATNKPCASPDEFLCVRGVCCQRTGLRCSDNVKVPTSSCVANQCPPQTPALKCEQPTNLCCETTSASTTYECPGKVQWLGPCAGGKDGICAGPAICNDDGQCCASPRCADGSVPGSTCDSSGKCTNLGANFVCEKPSNICCSKPASNSNPVRG